MTFFYVKYGKGQNAVFNADCRIRVLLDAMQETCQYQEHDIVDLVKLDAKGQTGECLMLHTLLDEQATTCITTRESYLLCHVMKEKPADAKEPAIKFICLAQGEDGTPLLTSEQIMLPKSSKKKQKS